MFRLRLVLCSIFVFSSCASGTLDTLRQYEQPPINSSCEASNKDANANSLASLIEPYAELMEGQTGVMVLEDGASAMVSRAWLADHAKKTIDVQYFIFSADNVGLIAQEHLLRAADRGVRVRLLLDDTLADGDANILYLLATHPNFEVQIFNPNVNVGKNLGSVVSSVANDFKGVNQRMHNKTFVVDGQVAITGGRNIADEYFDYNGDYSFRDRDLLLLGQTAGTIQTSFDAYWASEKSVSILKVLKDAPKETLDQTRKWLLNYACDAENFIPQVRQRIKAVPDMIHQQYQNEKLRFLSQVDFLADPPEKNNVEAMGAGGSDTTATFIALLKQAKKEVIIQSPYLVTTDLARSLFRDLKKRGVPVKIITNSLASTDNVAAFGGYQRDREALLATGAEIFEVRPDAAIATKLMTSAIIQEGNERPTYGLHAKTIVVDRSVAVVTTFNLDPRSAHLNTECLVLVHDEATASDIATLMDEEMLPENAWSVTTESNPDSEASFSSRLLLPIMKLVPKTVL